MRARGGPRKSMRHIGLQERVLELKRALVLAVREAAAETLGSDKGVRAPVDMELRCKVEPGNPWKISCQVELGEQIREAVKETTARPDALRRGRLYCYRCESSCCEHSVPPSAQSVFGGYSPTGLPRWVDFHQLLLEVRHPRLGELFEGSGKDLLAVYSAGPCLKAAQLEVFGRMSRAYDLLGQVAFGFIPIGRERVAFTAQAVQCRGPDGLPRVELNLLAGLPCGEAAWDALEAFQQGRVRDLLAEARRKIQQVGIRPGRGPTGQASTDPLMDGSERVLRGLARKLERLGRQARRRTLHAEARREDSRPTHKALEDAAAAPGERILWDVRRKTVVVLGPRQRVHVFSPQGRHITSLVLDGEAVESRIRRRRWVIPEGELLESFKLAIGRAKGSVSRT